MAAMVDAAGTRVVTGEDVSGSGASAEALGRYLRSHAKELAEEPDSPLFFGRLDFDRGPVAGDHQGQRYYIGRRRIARHPSAPPLVVDWRAPVSRAFYQATAREPQGVAVRRRFGWAPWSTGAAEDLTSLEDERLTAATEPATAGAEAGDPGAAGQSATAGRGAGASGTASRIVAAEIERPRVGPMRDIVATIQPEQDDLVRGELTASVCVQGAPGTGKTAVGLHRAAYLLYTCPQRVQRAGLLVIGPNRTFLRYISQVLPALGESDVRQCTLDDLIARPRLTIRATDDPAAAAVKHSARMAEVLSRALYGRVRTPAEPLAVPDGSYRWRIDAAELDRIVTEVRDEAPPYAVGRERVRSRAVALLQRQAERRAGPPNTAWLRRMGRAKAVTAFLDAVWPAVRPEEVVGTLLADPAALAAAADGVLDADEQRALAWRTAPRSYKSAKWSPADMVLIDEVAGLIERPEGYGHVVVDEAQDLSPMQCRAIARRSDFGSLTVLGDLAQGTTPWAARSWPEHLTHLGKPQAAIAPLTTGFRVPAAVVALANRLLGALDVHVPPARSLRGDGELRIRAVSADGLPDATAATVRKALARDGSVAVIAADADVAAVRAGLDAAGIGTAAPDESDAGRRVVVLPATVAKGLEYDHVVVVEPAAIAEAEPRGLHRLYVVLTRAVSRLDVLHARPLPGPLTDAAG
ncbi:AAA family ATPase [Streptomyces sp. XD-27]|uniref:HelD family protein n=1 Tax=Streptomyces sp. XD-27 TaxID=3062779 RepID=UPI0026F43301|nr:AAA family ATPase [Streptomyces sp. XD-27]WKX74557.1 AAA family ATPase [Streptomyces sp. XD-27]